MIPSTLPIPPGSDEEKPPPPQTTSLSPLPPLKSPSSSSPSPSSSSSSSSLFTSSTSASTALESSIPAIPLPQPETAETVDADSEKVHHVLKTIENSPQQGSKPALKSLTPLEPVGDSSLTPSRTKSILKKRSNGLTKQGSSVGFKLDEPIQEETKSKPKTRRRGVTFSSTVQANDGQESPMLDRPHKTLGRVTDANSPDSPKSPQHPPPPQQVLAKNKAARKTQSSTSDQPSPSPIIKTSSNPPVPIRRGRGTAAAPISGMRLANNNQPEESITKPEKSQRAAVDTTPDQQRSNNNPLNEHESFNDANLPSTPSQHTAHSDIESPSPIVQRRRGRGVQLSVDVDKQPEQKDRPGQTPRKKRSESDDASPSSSSHHARVGDNVTIIDDNSDDDDDIDDIPDHALKNVQEHSCFCVPLSNPVRAACFRISRSRWFDRFVMAMILTNCVFLALYDPLDQDPTSDHNLTLEYAEYVFAIVFTIEMFVKVLATGFRQYIKDPWNRLDFLIVITSYVIFFPELAAGNFTAIRSLRVLRPLRTLTHVPALKLQVTALLRSMPRLLDVLLLTMMVFLLFGIFGVQLFSGVLRQRCFDDATKSMLVDDTAQCTLESWMGRTCPEGSYCALGDVESQPNFGISSFDNVGKAWLVIFQTITLEGWTDIMYRLQDATNDFVILYFLVLVIFGSFFLVNLALAVIVESMETSRQEGPSKTQASKDDPVQDNEAPSQLMFYLSYLADEIWKSAMCRPLHPYDRNHTRSPLQQRCFKLVKTEYFTNSIMAAILINTILLASEFYNQPQYWTDFLEISNVVLTCIFLLEMVVKIIGLGMHAYWTDVSDAFDGTIVIISLVEIVASIIDPSQASSGGFTALRAFRLARIVKLVKNWEKMAQQLKMIIKCLKAISHFPVLLFLYMFIYTMLGMQMFGGQFRFEEGIPRMNFDNLTWAFLSVFQVLTREDWQNILYSGIRSVGWIEPIIYFTSLLLFGTYIILNLFVAMLVDQFAEQRRELERQLKKSMLHRRRRGTVVPKFIRERTMTLGKRLGDSFRKMDSPSSTSVNVGDGATPSPLSRRVRSISIVQKKQEAMVMPDMPNAKFLKRVDSSSSLMSTLSLMSDRSSSVSSTTPSPMKVGSSGSLGSLGASTDSLSSGTVEKSEDVVILELRGMSFRAFSPDNPLRVWLAHLVAHRYFERIILASIFVSTVSLATETPNLDPNSSLATVLSILDWVFLVIFFFEMLAKMIVYGALFGENAYLKNNWNRLDFFIVLISIVNIFLSGLKAFRTFRALRALRPLRVVSRYPALKLIVNTIFAALPNIGQAAMLCMVFFVIFGILGVQMFGGKFYSCTDPEVMTIQACTGFFNATVDGSLVTEARRWVNAGSHFDDFLQSEMTLFEMASGEGWVDVLFNGVDVVGVGHAPMRNYSEINALYFVAFIIVGQFFVVNLFVGVVIDTYDSKRAEFEKGKGGGQFMTQDQQEWVEAQKNIIKGRPKRQMVVPSNKLRNWMYRLCINTRFDYAIMFCIVINIVFMATRTFAMTAEHEAVLETSNLIFTLIFLFEFIVKIIALYPTAYFNDIWNRLDFVIVVGSLIGLFVNVGIGAAVLRVFRITRIFKLVRQAKGLLRLLQTLWIAAPSLANVGSLLFLLFLIYAILGMNLFGLVKLQENIDRHANFTTFGLSMLLLFRVSTGEAWPALMHDCMVQPPDCEPELDNCGQPVVAPMYFASFVIMVSFVLLNLFVAVMLNTYSEMKDDPSEQEKRHAQYRVDFEKAWATFDPKAKGHIDVTKLTDLLDLLEPPLGYAGRNWSYGKKIKFSFELHIPADPIGAIHFTPTYFAILEHAFGIEVPQTDVTQNVIRTLLKDHKKIAKKTLQYHNHHDEAKSRALKRLDIRDTAKLTCAHDEVFAAKIIAHRWRKYMDKLHEQGSQAQLTIQERQKQRAEEYDRKFTTGMTDIPQLQQPLSAQSGPSIELAPLPEIPQDPQSNLDVGPSTGPPSSSSSGNGTPKRKGVFGGGQATRRVHPSMDDRRRSSDLVLPSRNGTPQRTPSPLGSKRIEVANVPMVEHPTHRVRLPALASTKILLQQAEQQGQGGRVVVKKSLRKK